MTKKEMAVNLFSTAAAMESISGPSPLTLSMRAGAAALRAGEWKPIEGAPKDGTEILVCRWPTCDEKATDLSLSCQVAAWWSEENDGEGAWIVYCSILREPELHFEPTHYRELPPPPEAE